MTYPPQPQPDASPPGAPPQYPAYPSSAVPGYGQQQAYPPPGYLPVVGQSGYPAPYSGYAPQGQYPPAGYPMYPQMQPQPMRVTNQRANVALIDGGIS